MCPAAGLRDFFPGLHFTLTRAALPCRTEAILLSRKKRSFENQTQARTQWGAEANTSNNTVRWAAFYFDCEHEVTAVTTVRAQQSSNTNCHVQPALQSSLATMGWKHDPTCMFAALNLPLDPVPVFGDVTGAAGG